MPLQYQLLIVCPLVFLAGFVDSIAGGGGLISLPAYYMAGLPPHLALGTNKTSSCIGTFASTLAYIRGKHVYIPLVPVSIAGALLGSFLGAKCALLLDEQVLRWIMMVLIPVLAAVTILKKDLFSPDKRDISPKREQILTAAIALLIGWYDGFFGPGTGTFLMLAFVGLLRLDVITACGNTKVVNLCSNIAAVAAFLLSGKVMLSLALPCAVFSLMGHALGARLTIKNGARLVKPVMLVVVALLLVTIGRDLFLSVFGGWA